MSIKAGMKKFHLPGSANSTKSVTPSSFKALQIIASTEDSPKQPATAPPVVPVLKSALKTTVAVDSESQYCRDSCSSKSSDGAWCEKLWGKGALDTLFMGAERNKLYAHCLKLFTLFVVAVVHVCYLHPFLEIHTHLEEYALHADYALAVMGSKNPSSPPSLFPRGAGPTSAIDTHPFGIKHIPLISTLHAMTEYKNNMWMSVAAMCVALSTSCYFLFINQTWRRKLTATVFMIAVADVISFAMLPLLFASRLMAVERIRSDFPTALLLSHRLVSAEALMNWLQCSVQPREKLPLCAERILSSIIPVAVLKFLFVFAVLTLAYIAVVYLIIWCVKHWVPHHYYDGEEGSDEDWATCQCPSPLPSFSVAVGGGGAKKGTGKKSYQKLPERK